MTSAGAAGGGNGYSNRGDKSKGVPMMDEGEWRMSELGSTLGVFAMAWGGHWEGVCCEGKYQCPFVGRFGDVATHLRDHTGIWLNEHYIVVVRIRCGTIDQPVCGKVVRLG